VHARRHRGAARPPRSRGRGQEVCILGRGTTLGRPLSLLLTQKRPTANAAVTVVHTGVPDWAAYTRRAAIVVAAVGVPGILRPEHIAPGATVVGGGVRYEGRRLLPDVDEACNEVAGAITPRVGGVGPTTVAMLFRTASRPPSAPPASDDPSAGSARAADAGLDVGGQRSDDAAADHLVGQPGAPVDAFGDLELHVEPEQVLLDGSLRDDELLGDVPGGGRGDEGVLLQGRPAQRGEHLALAAGEVGADIRRSSTVSSTTSMVRPPTRVRQAPKASTSPSTAPRRPTGRPFTGCRWSRAPGR
jgi:hypothetical protein